MSTAISRVYSNVSYALGTHTNAITLLQEQASSGNTVNRASDNPAQRLQDSRAEFRRSDAGQLQGEHPESQGHAGHVHHGHPEHVHPVVRHRNASDADRRGMYDADGRERIAEKVNSALEQLVSMVNTKQSGQYLFGGSDASTAPYVAEREDGNITSVIYQGSHQSRPCRCGFGFECRGLRWSATTSSG